MSALLESAKKALPGVKWQDIGEDGFEVVYGECAADKFNVFERSDLTEIRADLTKQRDALNAALGEGWIPVGERLPTPHVPVLGWAHTRVSYCVWHADLWISYGNGAPVSVTHWMPLPQSPKETP